MGWVIEYCGGVDRVDWISEIGLIGVMFCGFVVMFFRVVSQFVFFVDGSLVVVFDGFIYNVFDIKFEFDVSGNGDFVKEFI